MYNERRDMAMSRTPQESAQEHYDCMLDKSNNYNDCLLYWLELLTWPRSEVVEALKNVKKETT